MKKAEFKKIIKECIKEAIIEDGVLSSVISEVVKGLSAGQIVENKQSKVAQIQEEEVEREKLQEARTEKFLETKQKMLEAIGQDSYNGVNIFEGTTPMGKAGQPGADSRPGSPLEGVPPGDAGIDLSSFASAGTMKKIWQQMNK